MREEGFTLLELLVVVLIVGILAAIALPTFLGSTSRGQDGSAKSNARNLASQVEACYQTSQNYTSCNTNAKVTADGSVGMPWGTATGQVTVRSSAVATYTIRAVSKTGSTFDLAKAATGRYTRTCSPVNKGGCAKTGVW